MEEARVPSEEELTFASIQYDKSLLFLMLEELSFKEVAARMGRSEDACRMLLARAMVALTLRLRAAP